VVRKSLQPKNLRVNFWGSIICGEKVRNPLILKNRGGGGGVINWIIGDPKVGKAVDGGRWLVNS